MDILLFSALAGVCGTGLGGLAVAFTGSSTPASTCWKLSFAGGVMVSIVCFGLIPEAFQLSGVFVSVLGLALGVIVIMALNYAVDALTETRADKHRVHQTPEELYHESGLLTKKGIETKAMLKSGLMMFIAIALHNIPEGMAIGAGGSHDAHLGILLSVMIALHNIPEGMAIAAPLLAGGIRKGRVILITALSGAPTLIGGLVGILIGGISDTALALSLSAAGGAMLYVVFGEMIPQAVVLTKSRATTLLTLLGIIAGILVALML